MKIITFKFKRRKYKLLAKNYVIMLVVPYCMSDWIKTMNFFSRQWKLFQMGWASDCFCLKKKKPTVSNDINDSNHTAWVIKYHIHPPLSLQSLVFRISGDTEMHYFALETDVLEQYIDLSIQLFTFGLLGPHRSHTEDGNRGLVVTSQLLLSVW